MRLTLQKEVHGKICPLETAEVDLDPLKQSLMLHLLGLPMQPIFFTGN